jgi:hypothetical protein
MALGYHSFEDMTNDLGLVPMVITDNNFAPYMAGQIYGFAPDRAEEIYRLGSGRPATKEALEAAKQITKEPDAPPPPKVELVLIPDNWDSAEFHHLQRIRLAKTIAGTDRRIDDDEAKIIIRDEVERRKAINVQ